jgi:hypothetical protein
MNIRKFISEAKNNGGGSYNINSGLTNPSHGYMVSIEGAEQTSIEFPTDSQILDYIVSNSSELCHDDKYFGVWYNEDKALWYMDVSKNMYDYESARLMGAINNQIAIWDCAKGKEIKLASK